MIAAVKAGEFSGAVLISREGEVLLSKGYGLASLELGAPNNPKTKFRIGSITKQFTAMAIMILQERGKLNVQDPICKYVSECPQTWTGITVAGGDFQLISNSRLGRWGWLWLVHHQR
jgi:CubicO group peptidase (beta-lactamase class C family)